MELRERIIKESGELFTRNGIKHVTMDGIAQAMNISKRTIYENFKDKEDLLKSVLEYGMAEHKKGALEIIQRSDNVIEAMFEIGEKDYEVMKNFNPAFKSDLKKYYLDIFKEVVENGKIRNHEVTYLILKRGINEGIFLKDIDLDIATYYIHYSMDFTHLAEEKYSCDKKTILKSVHLPYLRGISTEKGRNLIRNFFENNENRKH